MPRLAICLLCSFAVGLLAGCGSDNVPPAGAEKQEQHTELRDAIQRPLDKARAVDATVQKAKQQQDKDIENQLNGQAPDAKPDEDKPGSQ